MEWLSNMNLEELIVKKGEIKEIEAGIHPPFRRIEIQSGGTLSCKKGDSWLMLYSKGDFILEGKIECNNFKTGLGKISGKSPNPDNQKLEAIYPENKRGGNGANSVPFNPASDRGYGAKGSINFGGGGASGRDPLCRNNSCKSYNGNNYLGGANPNRHIAKGGNGGRKKEFQNGGCLYIKIDGDLIAKNGLIDIRGNRGENGYQGENGGTVRGPRRTFDTWPGKGGGGAPGGDGGLLVVKVPASNIKGKPKILKSGGIGGRPGPNGSRIRTGWSDSRNLAQRGEDGNNGRPTIWITGW